MGLVYQKDPDCLGKEEVKRIADPHSMLGVKGEKSSQGRICFSPSGKFVGTSLLLSLLIIGA